jgi:hypothetical protein
VEESAQKNPVAEAIRLMAIVILFFGLIACGFYANSHNYHTNIFWWAAGAVFITGIFDIL